MKTLFILKFTTAAICVLILSLGLFRENVNGQANGWEFLNGPMAPGGVVDALVISPSEPDTLFTIIGGASEQRLFRSDDDSLTWQQVLTFTDVISEEITSLAIDPLSAETLYAGSKGRLMLSGNGGITWTQIFTMGTAIAVADANHLYVADKIGEPDQACSSGYFGIARSVNRGKDWAITPTGCSKSIPFLVSYPINVELIYAGSTDKNEVWGTVLRSNDGGKSFVTLPLAGQSTHPLQDLLVLPTDPTKLFVSDEYGIIYSEDSGDTWTRFTSAAIGTAPPSQNLPQAPFALAADGAGVIYAVDKFPSNRGVTTYRSDDGGKTWWSAIQKLPNGARILISNPHVSGKIYAGLDGFGIWKTDSSGGAWTERNTGIRSIVQVESLAVPLNDPTIIYAASYSGPRPGLYYSKNGGLSWTTVIADMPIRTVAVNPMTHTLAYAGTDSDLWTTEDGSTWYPNYVDRLINDFAISGAGPQWWYAIGVKQPFDFDSGGARLAQGEFLRFKPGDPAQEVGAYWESKSVQGSFWTRQIAVDPIDPNIVYAHVSTYDNDFIYRSIDGGENWEQLKTIDRSAEQILTDERFPDRIYVAGFAGTFLSHDHGETWSVIENGPNRIMHKVALDYNGNVCASTESGVWCQYDNSDNWYNTGLENVSIMSLVTSSGDTSAQWMYAGTANGVWRRKFEPVQINSTWLPLVQK